MKRVFIDTNILLDFMCNRQGFAQDAVQIVSMAVRGEIHSPKEFLKAYR